MQNQEASLEEHYRNRILELEKEVQRARGHTLVKEGRFNLPLLQEIFDYLPDPTFAIDLEGHVIAWNRSMESFFGVDRSEILGKSNFAHSVPIAGSRRPVLVDYVLHPNDSAEKYYDVFSRVGERLVAEKHYSLDDEKRVYLWGTAAPLRGASGNVIGAVETIRDISSHYETLHAAQENEDRYRALFEAGPDAILVMRDGRIVECNKTAESHFKTPRLELMGMSPFDLSPAIQPNGQQSSTLGEKWIQQAYEKGPVIFEWVHQRPDGTSFDAEVSLSKFMIRSRIYLHVIVRDISLRKQNERALIESRATLRTVLDQTPAAILLFGNDRSLILANERGRDMFGSSPGSSTHPDQQHYELQLLDGSVVDHEMWNDRLTRAFKGDVDAPVEIKLVNSKIEEERYLLSQLSPVLDAEGNTFGVLSYSTDVTDLKHAEQARIASEQRFRTIVERTFAPVVLVRKDGSIAYANKAANQTLKLEDNELTGRQVTDFIHPADRKSTLDRMRSRFMGESVPTLSSIRVLDSLGETHHVQLSSNLVRDEAGAPSILSMFIDVTELKRYEEEMHRTHSVMEKAARLASVGVIAGGVTHEINQPLNAILLHADTLRYMIETEGKHEPALVLEALEKILVSTRRIDEIVRSMRSYWIGSGRENELIELDSGLRDALRMIEMKLHVHAVEHTLECESELTISGNRLQFEQIVINLLSNAICALEDRPPNDRHVKLRGYREGGYVILEVEDNGPGLPTENLETLTDPLFSTRKDRDGTGLGLAIVKMYSERMGAQLAFMNKKESGVSVQLRFPATVRNED